MALSRGHLEGSGMEFTQRSSPLDYIFLFGVPRRHLSLRDIKTIR